MRLTGNKSWTLTAYALAGVLAMGMGAANAAQGSAGATADQAQSVDALASAAKNEGSVTWYSVLAPNQMNKLAENFEKKYGVHVNIIRSTTGKLVQRYDSELATGKVAADILSISDAIYYHRQSGKGVFKKIDAKTIPNAKAWPDGAIADHDTLVLSINPFVIAYNTNRLGKDAPPKKWKDLLKKEYGGNMGAPNFSVSATYIEFLNMWKNTLGDKFIKEYGKQKKRYYDSSVPGNQALAAGEFKVFAPTMPIFVQSLLEKGAPIKLAFPPTTTGNVIHAAISAKAPHPNAAALFMNYLMSHEAQEVINKGVSATLLPGVKGSLELPKNYEAPKPQQASDRKAELLKLVGLND